MAGGMDLGDAKGPKKPLDATINLVPFIDLMAVTISFLIMTAVWTQIGRLQVSGGGGDGDPTPEKDDKTVPVTLLLSEKDLRLTVGTSTFDPIPIVRDPKQQIDLTKLSERFKDVKEKLGPDQTAITVQTEDAVRYEDLVHVIDVCIGDGFPSVSVAPVST
jgi:biopolymer transport protein ExbD